ncbi:MAG TPA: PHP domain-containing protein [Limnochordia bacterium]|nr:PHP domain-containing protein [Limnochordia bacterium]
MEQNPIDRLIEDLNHVQRQNRLQNLEKLQALIRQGKLEKPVPGGFVNNHIHTTYSFSPYSPTKAVWMAYNAGLTTAGIMDHDSISGAREFIEAGRILGLATTIGVECRADLSETPLKGKRINNPDQVSAAYVALHGIPHTQIDKVAQYLAPYRKKRNRRNVAMTARLNIMLAKYGINLDFANDIVPLSQAREGGSITERHILYALSLKLIERFGKGEKLVDFLKSKLKLNFSTKLEGYLLDAENPYYTYDLLGVLKSDLVEQFYLPAADECPPIAEVVSLANAIGCILAYAYLGDVGESVTGDKKAQKFEDEYLEQLFEVITGLGFHAVTYMPSRNTLAQLLRVKALCRRHNLLEISGEDINTPRQSFICEALARPEFRNLVDSTWALIGHEIAATEDLKQAFFAPETAAKYPDLAERIEAYKAVGQKRS